MNSQTSGFFLTIGKRIIFVGAAVLLFAAVLWTIGLCVCRPVCALILLPAALAMKFLSAKQQKDIPMPAYLAALVLIALVTFALLPAPSGTDWAEPWAKAPQVSAEGSSLHLRYVRDFDFRDTKDYDIRYLEEDFSLEELCGVHLIESRRKGLLQDCDLLLSFVFNDGRTLVFGPEMRLPQGEQYNETQALYKGYGLLYMFGTEEDMLRLRTNLKHEYVSFHTLRLSHRQAQEMLAACARVAMTDSAGNKAYPPFAGQYDGAMQSILRIALPQLPFCLNENVAHSLFEHEILGAKQGEEWHTYQRRSAAGYHLAMEDRSAYAGELRRITESPQLPELLSPRHVQEESLAADRKGKNRADNSAPSSAAPSYTSPFTTGKGSTLAADIPEPGERLTVDFRDYSDSEYNSEEQEKDGEEAENKPAKDAIPEPKARMHADEMAASAAAERRERERKDAAEGNFTRRRGEEEAEAPRSSVDYGEFITGHKRSGIRIIEKPKAEEAPHPLDPYKRRDPFAEDKSKKEAPKDTDDLTSKPAPLHF